MTTAHRKRTIAAAIIFAFAGSAALAAKLWRDAPSDVCLCPAQRLAQAFDSAAARPADTIARASQASTTPSYMGGASSTALEALPPAALTATAINPQLLDRGPGAASSWTPWGSSSDYRVSSSGSSSHGGGASIGGLWAGMSPFGGHGSSANGSRSTTTKVTAKSTKAPSSKAPSSKAPSSNPAPPAPPASPNVPWPLPVVTNSPGTSMTPLPVPGASAGAGGSINAAATPEPGSLALISTGVLGLFGILRRKKNS